MLKRTLTILPVALATILGCGQSGGEAPGPSGSGAAGTRGAPTTTGAAAPGGKLVHVQQSKDECTFDFDAPEALKETATDGMSFTLKGAAFSFQGFAGSSLYGLDQLAGLSTMGSKDAPVVKETANGVNLVVTRNQTPAEPMFGVMGHGEEASHAGRDSPLGCSYLCSGPKDREADVLALCRSVRIKYDSAKAK